MTSGTVQSHLPAPKEVRDLLSDLLGKEVGLRPGPPFGVAPHYPASVASYVDDSLVVRAVVAMDLPLSAYVGAALALVPRSGAELAMEDGRLTGPLAESLAEVFNIVASLFNTSGAAHLRLYTSQVSGEAIAADARARTQILGRRGDFVVDVAGYGTGRLAVVLT
jgi:hypothetical protein